MTDKNDALFLVRLPFGQKTIPYEEVPELIAMAKSPGYDGEHEAVMLALDVCHEEGPLRAAVQAGEVEVLDKSLHRMTQPFNGRLKDTVLTVQALREYVESIKGFLEVEDAPQAASADDDVEEQAADALAAKVKAPPATSLNGGEWIVKAREFAREYLDRHKAQDLFPSQPDVCEYLEEILRKEKIYGAHGKPVSASYIARNAIQGEWWKDNKR